MANNETLQLTLKVDKGMIRSEDLGSFYLARLQRFVRAKELVSASGAPRWQRLASLAIMTSYSDCVGIGLEAQAKAILHPTSDISPSGSEQATHNTDL